MSERDALLIEELSAKIDSVAREQNAAIASLRGYVLDICRKLGIDRDYYDNPVAFEDTPRGYEPKPEGEPTPPTRIPEEETSAETFELPPIAEHHPDSTLKRPRFIVPDGLAFGECKTCRARGKIVEIGFIRQSGDSRATPIDPEGWLHFNQYPLCRSDRRDASTVPVSLGLDEPDDRRPDPFFDGQKPPNPSGSEDVEGDNVEGTPVRNLLPEYWRMRRRLLRIRKEHPTFSFEFLQRYVLRQPAWTERYGVVLKSGKKPVQPKTLEDVSGPTVSYHWYDSFGMWRLKPIFSLTKSVPLYEALADLDPDPTADDEEYARIYATGVGREETRYDPPNVNLN